MLIVDNDERNARAQQCKRWCRSPGHRNRVGAWRRVRIRDALLAALVVGLLYVPFLEPAKEHGALVMLDDYQDCGTRPIDVKAMGVDFYVSGTLKYLLGPWTRFHVCQTVTDSLAFTLGHWLVRTGRTFRF
jgi:hypothetical protein